MDKKGLSLFLFSVLFIGLASAQFYGTASIGNMLNSVDDSTLVLGGIFLIVFLLVNYSLEKFFKGNKAVAGGISFAVALLVIWGVNRSGFEYTNLFYGTFFFLPTGFLETLWPLLFIGIWIFLIFKNTGGGFVYGIRKGTGLVFLFSGMLLVFLALIGAFYESGATMASGFFLAGLGLVIGWFSNKKHIDMQHIQLHR